MSETEQVVEFWLPLDQLHTLIDQGIKEPLRPKWRMYSIIPPEPGDEQKCEEIEDIFTPKEYEAVFKAISSLLNQFDGDIWRPLFVPLGQRDYNEFSAHLLEHFKLHVPRESLPGIRKCLELAVASHGPRGWMGRCLLQLEAKFAALEAA
jgi:hypothetical protein